MFYVIYRVPSKLALETAKMNVEKYFPVVGLTSDLSNFFYVLDYKIPNFFRDSYSLYKQLGKFKRTITKESVFYDMVNSICTDIKVETMSVYDCLIYTFTT